MYAPAISPHDPDLLFVACDMGGVYRSPDGGRGWTMLDKRALRDTGGCPLVFDARDATVVYAATKRELKTSSDGGVHWTTRCAQPPWAGSACAALAVADDGGTMLAGGDRGAWWSADAGRTWSACGGVSGRVVGAAIVADPATPAGRTSLVATSDGVFRSDDDGETSRPSATGLPGGEVRVLATGSAVGSCHAVLYVTVCSRPAEGRVISGIWRSTDLGRTWQSVATVEGAADVGPEYERVAATDGDVVFATVRRGVLVGIDRSDDGGATWQPVLAAGPGDDGGRHVAAGWIVADRVWRSWRGAAWGFAVSRRDPRHALFTNAGELYRTTDAGVTWASAYAVGDEAARASAPTRTNGLDVTSAWQVAFDPHDRRCVYVCYTDVGFARSVDGGATWRHATRGMPWCNTVYQLACDPHVPGLLYAACSAVHDIPHWLSIDAGSGDGGVCVSRDFGATWAPLGTGLPSAPATSIVLDPRSPRDARTLHVAMFGAGVYTSIDGGATWRASATQPARAENRHVYRLKLCGDGTLYCTVTARRAGYAFRAPGGLHRSRDGGATWSELLADAALRWPGDVDTPPDDSATIWLGVASAPGHPQGGVYKSIDDGATWRCVLAESELPLDLCAYAHSHFVTVDPSRPATVYVGAITHGLFVTHDAGATWREVAGLPFTGCQRVAFDPDDPDVLWVTTFGGGVWKGRAPR